MVQSHPQPSDRHSTAMTVAIGAGALALVCCAFSTAFWWSKIALIHAENPGTTHGSILARQGMMISAAFIVAATTVLALLLRLQRPERREWILTLALGSLGCMAVLIGLYWGRWRFNLDFFGPKAMVGFSVVQYVALGIASLQRTRHSDSEVSSA